MSGCYGLRETSMTFPQQSSFSEKNNNSKKQKQKQKELELARKQTLHNIMFFSS
jgi:hypothetical protein